MLSAPDAPAPTATNRMDAIAINGCTCPGATTSPTAAVKTTSDITRGFNRANRSPISASRGVSIIVALDAVELIGRTRYVPWQTAGSI